MALIRTWLADYSWEFVTAQNALLCQAKAFVVRSLAGHIVAGVATSEEEKAFREFCASLDKHG